MHRHQESTRLERKARQSASEKALREKNGKNALARLAQEQAIATACTVLEGVLAKEARAEKAEGYRIAFVARNPVVECIIREESGEYDGARIPFAALPMQCQRAAVVEYLKLHA